MDVWRRLDTPEKLPSERVSVLDVYGSLFFASARTMLNAMPDPADATRPAVVLRLRGRTNVGATLIDEEDDDVTALTAVGGKLFLGGVDDQFMNQMRRARKLQIGDHVDVFPADRMIGELTGAALNAARS